jgi:hypothetical protein
MFVGQGIVIGFVLEADMNAQSGVNLLFLSQSPMEMEGGRQGVVLEHAQRGQLVLEAVFVVTGKKGCQTAAPVLHRRFVPVLQEKQEYN